MPADGPQLKPAHVLFYTRDMHARCGLVLLSVVAALFVATGCQKSRVDTSSTSSKASARTNAAAQTNAAPVDPNQLYLNHAQPKLHTTRLWIGTKEMSAEVAASIQEISTGMMFRKEIGDDEGMLFIFGRPHRASFYMRNTVVPLSAAYIDPGGTILEIHDLKPLEETPVTAATDRVQFVLETKQGWFEKNGIATNTVVRTEFGSLAETFLTKWPPSR